MFNQWCWIYVIVNSSKKVTRNCVEVIMENYYMWSTSHTHSPKCYEKTRPYIQGSIKMFELFFSKRPTRDIHNFFYTYTYNFFIPLPIRFSIRHKDMYKDSFTSFIYCKHWTDSHFPTCQYGPRYNLHNVSRSKPWFGTPALKALSHTQITYIQIYLREVLRESYF